MESRDITVIVTAHREGLILIPTFLSLDRALAAAGRAGIGVETIVVLDRSDELTVDLVTRWVDTCVDARLIVRDHGDLGLSRNAGVAVAAGRWTAFLDADDLWSENWLVAAFGAAEAESRETVWHPEASLYFGAAPHVFLHTDMDDPDFDLAGLALHNYWTALAFCRRELALAVPYIRSDLQKQIGFEDWTWNIETIRNGAVHKTVRGCWHAVRVKDESLVKKAGASGCLQAPTELFRQVLERRAVGED